MPRRATAQPTPFLARFTRKVIATVLVGFVPLLAVVWLGFTAAALIRQSDRYTIPLSDIDYAPPAWVDRATFLAEVRYLGELPERFNVYDETAVNAIKAAFEKHPWVERVAKGTFTLDRRYQLEVIFREPVLLARTTETPPTAWMVDAHGVVLPSIHIREGLTELVVPVPAPKSSAGKPWDDATVKRAANLATLYRAMRIEKTENGWRITERDGRVLVLAP
jgi:hypothetical protein